MSAAEQARDMIREVIVLTEIGKKDDALLKLKAALNLTKEIKSEYLRPRVLNEIAQALFRLDKTEEALQVIHEAKNIANQIVFTASRLEILLEVAKSLSEINFEIKKRQVLQEALEITKEILANVIDISRSNITYEVAVILRNIVRTTEDPRMLHEILRINDTEQLDNRHLRRMLVRSISYRLAELCENTSDTTSINEVLKLMNQIKPSNYRSKTIVKIARLLTKTAERTENPELIQIAITLSDTISSDYYRSKIKSRLSILKEKSGRL